MRNLVVRILVNAVALWVAAKVVPGVHVMGGVVHLLLIAVVFGVVNAIVKPIVKFFTFPFILLTLGLFTLVINALMVLLTAGLLRSFSVDGFMPAFWAGLITSVVSFCLSVFLKEKNE